MKKHLLSWCILLCIAGFSQTSDSIMLRRLYNHYLTQSSCYGNLEHLATKIGGRLSGSSQAEAAVKWAKQAMYAAGADTVILQPCMVPHWVRGKKEICRVVSPPLNLNCVALGSSVGTGKTGITAEVIEVRNFEELEQLGKKNVGGKIVFYNVFFNQEHQNTSDGYRETVGYRVRGASFAARFGAVAILVRSMTSVADDEPHTGNMHYDSTLSITKIPALALSYKAADKLSEALKKDKTLRVYMEDHCQSLPPVLSYNVVGQITGSEKPNEYLTAGGHLDSWDTGQGAQDDGAGVVQCMAMLQAFKQLGVKPKRSIRAVAFMNEENGLAGGIAYAKFAEAHHEKHIAALETDAGGYTPRGFGIDTLNGLYTKVLSWKHLFKPYYIDRINMEGGGADLRDLEKLGVPCMGFEPDGQRYFDIHHTAADTFDKVNKRELELGAAAIGALMYLLDTHY